MGLLDELLGGVIGQMGQQGGQQGGQPGASQGHAAPGGAGLGAAAGGGGALLAMAMQFVSNYPGGLPALIGQFTKAGHGEQASSWVGQGQNAPISADVLSQVFGQERIEQAGQQFGVDPQVAAGGLAGLLPELVNQLTPKGQIEPQVRNASGDELASLLEGLKRNFG
jgi:uncharacterized protein YidB (DUF937 family)